MILNPFAGFARTMNPAQTPLTIDIYPVVETLGTSKYPIRTYPTARVTGAPIISIDAKRDMVFDPQGTTGREVYKQVQAVYIDPGGVTVLPTDRIFFQGNYYDQTGSPANQVNIGLLQRIDMRQVMEEA